MLPLRSFFKISSSLSGLTFHPGERKNPVLMLHCFNEPPQRFPLNQKGFVKQRLMSALRITCLIYYVLLIQRNARCQSLCQKSLHILYKYVATSDKGQALKRRDRTLTVQYVNLTVCIFKFWWCNCCNALITAVLCIFECCFFLTCQLSFFDVCLDLWILNKLLYVITQKEV